MTDKVFALFLMLSCACGASHSEDSHAAHAEPTPSSTPSAGTTAATTTTSTAQAAPKVQRVEQAASTWKAHPEFVAIDVQGNADPNEPKSVELSRERANRVVQEFVRLGVDSKRLTVVGYGAACEPHAQVSFKVVATADGPTGVTRCTGARDAGP